LSSARRCCCCHSTALGFSLTTWRSPSGNIACRYYIATKAVACQTDNNHRAVALESNFVFETKWTPLPRRSPVLRYGEMWRSRYIFCASQRDGMRCSTISKRQNQRTHGFLINRLGIRTW